MELQTDFIKTELQKFNLSDAAITQMKSEYLPIIVKDHTDKETAKKAREARLLVKDHRVKIEKMRKSLKEDSLKFGKSIDAEAKRLTIPLEEIEEHLQIQEDIVSKYMEQLEAEARAKAEQERIEKEKALEAKRQAIEAEKRKLESERQALEAEKRKFELEQQRQIELEHAKQEAARQAVLETENRIKRETEEKQRFEREKIEREAREIEEQKRREAREIEEQKRREAREIEEQKRREANAPDKEKLIAFSMMLKNIEIPEVKGVEAQKIISNIKQRLYELSEYCSRQIIIL